MADPITWLAIGSAAFGAVGAIQQGEQANAAAQSDANMAEYNAKMNEIQARQAYAGAGRQEEEQRRRARAQIGQSLAASAEAGAGLNGDVLRTSVFDAESDALAIRYEGNLKAQGLKDSAELQRSSAVVARDRGKQAITGSYLNAGSALLNAGTSYYKGKK
jgi:hypothetical protein